MRRDWRPFKRRWLAQSWSIKSCQAGTGFFRNHIQLVPMLAIPYIIHISIPSSYHSSMCMCKRHRITFVGGASKPRHFRQTLDSHGHIRDLRLYRELLRQFRVLTASPCSVSYLVLRNGPLVKSSSLSPEISLRRTEANPHWFSKFVVMLSFINWAKVKFSFCSGTGKVLLDYWLRANPKFVGGKRG